MEKAELIPIRVPWMISPSGSFLKVDFNEEEESLITTAHGFFGRHSKDNNYSVANGLWVATSKPDTPTGEILNAVDGYHDIRILFNGVLGFKVAVLSDLRSIISYAEIFPWNQGVADGAFYLDNFELEWQETLICPVSDFFEYKNNSISDQKFHTYLVKGRDYGIYIESFGYSAIP